MSGDMAGLKAPHVVLENRGGKISIVSWHDDAFSAKEEKEVRQHEGRNVTRHGDIETLAYTYIQTSLLATSRPRDMLEDVFA
jgi:hypothetical protein